MLVEESSAELDDVWRGAARITGWLTRDQAAVLLAEASSLAPGEVAVEIGSHRGRSTVVLAAGLTPGARLLAVDPFDPGWRYGGRGTRRHLERNLLAAGVRDRVDVAAMTSRAARSSYAGSVGLLFIDGKHDYRTVRDDLEWTGRVPDGRTVLVHDAFGSVGVTLALLRTLATSDRLAYEGRTRSLAVLRTRRPGPRDRVRPLGGLPWFGRNVVVKVLLRLRLSPVARLLGHADACDPY